MRIKFRLSHAVNNRIQNIKKKTCCFLGEGELKPSPSIKEMISTCVLKDSLKYAMNEIIYICVLKVALYI